MSPLLRTLLVALTALPVVAAGVLQRSDVVFMYQADAKTYADYGATVLAWGGKPTPQSIEEAKGVKFFGSVGMVTEFSRYYERFPQTYDQGLCRDVNGQPVKVPWLTDHQHKGIPYWWCCTAEKGTHWYAGPTDKFAPLYRFVRTHAGLFDGYENMADVALVLPHAAFLRHPDFWFDIAGRLTATNLPYRILLAGDEIVAHPLPVDAPGKTAAVLVPNRTDLRAADRATLEAIARTRRVFTNVVDTLAAVRPAVQARAAAPVRVLPRVKSGSLAVHVLNYEYDPTRDDVRPLSGVRLAFATETLGVARDAAARWVRPDGPEVTVNLREGSVELPPLGLWGILVLATQAP